MLRFFFAGLAWFVVLLTASAARADKVAVLPFTGAGGVSKPELERARAWVRDAVIKRGHVPPNDSEMLSAEMAVKDGMPDMSQEYRAAGRASGSQWTLSGRVDRHDTPPAKLPDGTEEDGFTSYRVEVEACEVDSGRVESLAREIDPDDAPAQIAEMLGLLLRAEGIHDSPLPWDPAAPRKRKPKPKPEPPPPPPPPPKPEAPPPAPRVKHVYAEHRPGALGLSVGASAALARPDNARGPSGAMHLGGVLAYAIEAVPGLELRGIFTSQVVGPRALEISGGARYAIPILPQYRVFFGPEVLLGGHVPLGADKTARFLAHGAAFVAIGLGEQVQLEVAGDLSSALGGAGTLVLGGGTARALFRF